NAAAYTDVDGAEAAPELAQAVNGQGAENVARAARAIGAAVVHYSTDFVFDGTLERPYDERDPPSPQGAYARSKVAGDARVAAATPRHFIVRVGCLYGRGGRNFPSTVVRRLRAGETLRADRDRRVSPTWVREPARVSAALARTAFYGLYHCTAQGETTWARVRAPDGRPPRPPGRARRGPADRVREPAGVPAGPRDPRQPGAA
ncbi:MAG TPA: sugar nucleotide-binding protein, partial [Polyangia bacterium]|nr:sugar nucleotide-binding protein [Polyangia bacterium]